jgi:Acetyltransferase (GNAT) domain
VLLVRDDAPGALDSLMIALEDFVRQGYTVQYPDVPEGSATALAFRTLMERSPRGRLIASGETPCPRLSLSPESVQRLYADVGFRRHTRKLTKAGALGIEHLREASSIDGHLEQFFEQHVGRWSGTKSPSLFLKPANRRFYRELTREFDNTGDLVFTVVRVDGRAAAFHFGFVSDSTLLWYKPTFDLQLGKYSPGQSLLRALIDFAISKGLHAFDFTRGDEPFKRRLASEVRKNVSYHWYVSSLDAARAHWWRLVRAARRRVSPVFS